MKICIIFAVFGLLVGCKNAGKNQSAGQIPEGMECPASMDPSQGCPAATNPTGQVLDADHKAPPVSTKAYAALQEISGTCEMVVDGDKTPRTCEELQLVVHSRRKNEERHAQISGFNIRFGELTQSSYRFTASSPKYFVKFKTGELSPGQIVKIRVRAKLRR